MIFNTKEVLFARHLLNLNADTRVTWVNGKQLFTKQLICLDGLYPMVNSCVQDIDKLLDMEKSNVRIVGIRGIGGIGKITFAKAMFNSSRLKFKSSCFLTDVTSTSMPHRGLSQLQETHLFDILGDSDLKVSDCNV
ncbi:hypothetical protein ABKV19_020512 [Rosa sericea]